MDVIIGATITILLVILVEYLRRPKLEIRIIPPKDKDYSKQNKPAEKMRALCVECYNKPLPKWAKWMSRNAAVQAHGTITFYNLDGQNLFGRSMPIRWSSAPEPVPSTLVLDDKRISFFDPSTISLNQRVDIYPGETQGLDVVSRFDEEKECFGWNNESYFAQPTWRNPNWQIPEERYLVNIHVVSSGEHCSRIFRLINNVHRNDFRLENPLPEDKLFE